MKKTKKSIHSEEDSSRLKKKIAPWEDLERRSYNWKIETISWPKKMKSGDFKALKGVNKSLNLLLKRKNLNKVVLGSKLKSKDLDWSSKITTETSNSTEKEFPSMKVLSVCWSQNSPSTEESNKESRTFKTCLTSKTEKSPTKRTSILSFSDNLSLTEYSKLDSKTLSWETSLWLRKSSSSRTNLTIQEGNLTNLKRESLNWK